MLKLHWIQVSNSQKIVVPVVVVYNLLSCSINCCYYINSLLLEVAASIIYNSVVQNYRYKSFTYQLFEFSPL